MMRTEVDSSWTTATNPDQQTDLNFQSVSVKLITTVTMETKRRFLSVYTDSRRHVTMWRYMVVCLPFTCSGSESDGGWEVTSATFITLSVHLQLIKQDVGP